MNITRTSISRTLALVVAIGLINAFTSDEIFAAGDDFNDNAKDASKWGADTNVGGGVFTERNQRLEYTCASPGIPEDDAIRPWILTRFPYNADWEMQIDTFNSTVPNQNFQVNSAGITLLSPLTTSDDIFVELYSSQLGGPPARTGFQSDLTTGGSTVAQVDGGINGITNGAVRLAFNSTTKVITAFYDSNVSNGYQWVQFASFGVAGAGGANGNTNWGLTASDQFSIFVYGFSQGMAINSGQMYLDNFMETGGIAPAGPPSPDPIGSFRFGFPSNNPLLTRIVDLSGNYRGTAPRNYSIDVAQDETGQLAIMGTMDGVKNANGSPVISSNVGTIKTVNGEPTAQLNGSFTGTRDGVNITASGTAVVPVKVVDVGGGNQGVAGTGSYKSNIGGVSFSATNAPLRLTAPPGAVNNLKKDWSFQLDIAMKLVEGKGNGKGQGSGKGKGKGKSHLGTFASARLLLPNGDTIVYPDQTIKPYSAKKGHSLSFNNGTNITKNPPAIDKNASITITGLKFVQQGAVWRPSGGTITYQFLGQQGKANLLDFVMP